MLDVLADQHSQYLDTIIFLIPDPSEKVLRARPDSRKSRPQTMTPPHTGHHSPTEFPAVCKSADALTTMTRKGKLLPTPTSPKPINPMRLRIDQAKRRPRSLGLHLGISMRSSCQRGA